MPLATLVRDVPLIGLSQTCRQAHAFVESSELPKTSHVEQLPVEPRWPIRMEHGLERSAGDLDDQIDDVLDGILRLPSDVDRSCFCTSFGQQDDRINCTHDIEITPELRSVTPDFRCLVVGHQPYGIPDEVCALRFEVVARAVDVGKAGDHCFQAVLLFKERYRPLAEST